MKSIRKYSFTWDPAKAQSNKRKHGVSFDAAVTVFEDQLAIVLLDPDTESNEERWVIIGLMEEKSERKSWRW